MNMTSNGIGWGATQNYSGYNGSTINAPVGCVVTVYRFADSAPTAKFSGTWARLGLSSNSSISYNYTGSQFGLMPTSYESDGRYYGGDIYKALLEEKGGSINGLFNKCRTLVRHYIRSFRVNLNFEDRGVDKGKFSTRCSPFLRWRSSQFHPYLPVECIRWGIKCKGKRQWILLCNEGHLAPLKEVA